MLDVIGPFADVSFFGEASSAIVAAIPLASLFLSATQMGYLMNHHNVINHAFDTNDMDTLHAIAESDEFGTVFGDMSFDEAWDRYESMASENGVNDD